MKISCQSCHSKYNVADEKVQGKIVKIRCRKCGATIVVNGTGGAATNGTNGADATGQGGVVTGDTTQWHVNVAENDQRTLTLVELVDAYNSGVVTQDTFIWTDGMDDWKPLAEVEAVVSALHASANHVAAIGTSGAFEPQAIGGYEPPAAPPPAEEPPPYEPPPAYEAPAAAYAAPMAAAPEPKRAAVAKREARARDLFATNAGEELQTSAANGGGEGSLTGQRNENSVLFSLAVLTQNADARPQTDTSSVNAEDSGLIDLKALAAKAESMRPPPGMGGDVFHAPLGLTPPLGAPTGALSMGAEAQPKSKLPLFIGAGAGVLVLLVLGIIIGVKVAGPGPAPVPTMVITTVTAPPVEPPPSATAAAAPDTSASAAPSASVATGPKRATGPGAWHPGAAAAPGPAPGPKSGPAGGSGGAAGPAAAPTPAPKKSGGDCGCNGDLMCLMKCSTH